MVEPHYLNNMFTLFLFHVSLFFFFFFFFLNLTYKKGAEPVWLQLHIKNKLQNCKRTNVSGSEDAHLPWRWLCTSDKWFLRGNTGKHKRFQNKRLMKQITQKKKIDDVEMEKRWLCERWWNSMKTLPTAGVAVSHLLIFHIVARSISLLFLLPFLVFDGTTASFLFHPFVYETKELRLGSDPVFSSGAVAGCSVRSSVWEPTVELKDTT